MLEIRDLTLSYGGRLALRDVSLSLAKGWAFLFFLRVLSFEGGSK